MWQLNLIACCYRVFEAIGLSVSSFLFLLRYRSGIGRLWNFIYLIFCLSLDFSLKMIFLILFARYCLLLMCIAQANGQHCMNVKKKLRRHRIPFEPSSWESNFLLQFAPPYTFIRTKKISLSHEFSSARPQNERRKILEMFYQSMFLHIWSTWNWFFLVILVQTAFLTSIANPRSDKLKFFHIQFKLQ